VIFGGRNGLGYFNDVWAFRLSTGEWEDWTPTDGNAPSPMGRDHFGAVYDAGHMYVYGESCSVATCTICSHHTHCIQDCGFHACIPAVQAYYMMICQGCTNTQRCTQHCLQHKACVPTIQAAQVGNHNADTATQCIFI